MAKNKVFSFKETQEFLRLLQTDEEIKIDCRYEIPKIRTLRSAIKEFMSRYIYKKTIRPELIAEIVKAENFMAYIIGNKRLLNFDT